MGTDYETRRKFEPASTSQLSRERTAHEHVGNSSLQASTSRSSRRDESFPAVQPSYPSIRHSPSPSHIDTSPTPRAVPSAAVYLPNRRNESSVASRRLGLPNDRHPTTNGMQSRSVLSRRAVWRERPAWPAWIFESEKAIELEFSDGCRRSVLLPGFCTAFLNRGCLKTVKTSD